MSNNSQGKWIYSLVIVYSKYHSFWGIWGGRVRETERERTTVVTCVRGKENWHFHVGPRNKFLFHHSNNSLKFYSKMLQGLVSLRRLFPTYVFYVSPWSGSHTGKSLGLWLTAVELQIPRGNLYPLNFQSLCSFPTVQGVIAQVISAVTKKSCIPRSINSSLESSECLHRSWT